MGTKQVKKEKRVRGTSERPAKEKAQVSKGPGITRLRGSPYRIQDPKLGRSFWLFPSLHPAAVMPFRSPRLAPLLGIDFRKFTRLLRGQDHIPPINQVVTQDPDEIDGYFRQVIERAPLNLQGSRVIALDLEWSRQENELVCIGIGGPLDTYLIIPYNQHEGHNLGGNQRQAIGTCLHRWFGSDKLAWGGHFACGYDERKLKEVGLDLTCSWDSLYGFHLCFAEFGTARDEEADQAGKGNSQASGYDLGFVSSVLTPYTYHKGTVTHDKDALSVPSQELWSYCAGDVARTYHTWLAIEREAASEFADIGQFWSLLGKELECARRAQRMTSRGVPINNKLRKARMKEVEQERESYKQLAQRVTGDETFNLNSPQQIGKYLRSKGVKVRLNHKTDNPMLNGNEIEKLLAKYPDDELLSVITRYRNLGTQVTAYKNMEPMSDGRAHPSWKIHGTVGSRWSSTPNYQNITKALRDIIG